MHTIFKAILMHYPCCYAYKITFYLFIRCFFILILICKNYIL